MLALEFGLRDSIHGPNRFTCFLIEFDHFSNSCIVVPTHRAVEQLQVKGITVEHRSAGHPKLNIEFAKLVVHIQLPNALSIDGITGQDTGAKETPNMLAVGARRRRCRVPFASACVLIARSDLLLPKFLSILGAYSHQNQVVSLGAGQKDSIVPDHRRRTGLARQLASPKHVFLRRPLRSDVLLRRYPIILGASPLRPILSHRTAYRSACQHPSKEDCFCTEMGHGQRTTIAGSLHRWVLF